MVDVGDADIVHTDMAKATPTPKLAVRKILRARAMPVVLGGDHSVHAPVIKAFDTLGPIHIVHFDAHLDFVNERHGVRYGHGNPLRRASEMAAYHRHDAAGHSQRLIVESFRTTKPRAPPDRKFFSVRQIRKMGVAGVLENNPSGEKLLHDH